MGREQVVVSSGFLQMTPVLNNGRFSVIERMQTSSKVPCTAEILRLQDTENKRTADKNPNTTNRKTIMKKNPVVSSFR